MTNSTSYFWPYCVNQLFTVEVVRRSFLSVYVPLSKQAILAWKQALVLKMFAAWKLFQAQAGPGSHIGLHNPNRIWPISFQKLHFQSNPFQWLSRTECIHNPITAMGFSEMFTFQLDNIKRWTLPALHCCNGSFRYVRA